MDDFNHLSNLLEHPKTPRKLGANLRQNPSTNTLHSLANDTLKISELLGVQDIKGIEKIFQAYKDVDASDVKLSAILQKFSHLKLPEDLKEIRALSHPVIRAKIFAAIINLNELSIKNSFLTKNELKEVGPYLTYLDCKDILDAWNKNEIDTFLQSCTLLRTLKINSAKITKLPNLLSCEELDCSWCQKLTELPELPACKILNCKSCTKLTNLTSLPLCEMLDCSECVNLNELPNLDKCKELCCSSCKRLDHLPPLPLCEMLDCSKCLNLRELPALSKCEKLNCSVCTSLTELPDLNHCIELNCFRCTMLNTLRALPVCEELNCCKCINLRMLIPLPACKELHCSGCTNLSLLSSLPVCEELRCSNCPRLILLPRLPLCRSIIYNDCPALDITTLPVSIRQQNQFEASIHTIHLKELMEDPLGILLNLEIPLLQHRSMPRIQFIELDGRKAEGYDGGGVFRIFISRLMQSLISHLSEPKQLKFIETESGLHMPACDNKRDFNSQIKGFQILGAIFELCYQTAATRQNVTTGICFDRKLFESIGALSYEELEALNLKELPSDLRLKFLSIHSSGELKKILDLLQILPENLDSEQFETLKSYALATIDLEEEEVPESLLKSAPSLEEIRELKLWIHAYLKSSFLNEENDLNTAFATAIIAKQMQQLKGSLEEWEDLQTLGALDLDNKIQGVINKETFLASIEWKTGNRNLGFEKINETKNYVTTWINNSSLKDIESLVAFITGSPSLNPEKKLSFELYDTSSERLPSTHTCSFEIDLSVNYPNYETFKQKLEMALSNINSTESSSLEIQ